MALGEEWRGRRWRKGTREHQVRVGEREWSPTPIARSQEFSDESASSPPWMHQWSILLLVDGRCAHQESENILAVVLKCDLCGNNDSCHCRTQLQGRSWELSDEVRGCVVYRANQTNRLWIVRKRQTVATSAAKLPLAESFLSAKETQCFKLYFLHSSSCLCEASVFWLRDAN